MALGEFHARIQQTETDPVVSVRIVAPAEIANLPREEAEARLSNLLQQVRVGPEFIMYGFWTRASYVDPLSRAALLGHNTLVEISIPYTLHLPNDLPFEVTYPQGSRATVVMRKIWTTLAAGSNDAEIYADDRVLYYGPAQPLSPFIPQAPELGPWPHFTGTNVEIGKDTHGVFRYTQIRVFFDSALIGVDGSETDEAVQAARSRAFEEAKQTGMSIVNYVLDIYRYVTSAEHVERLSAMAINRVYFVDYNLLSEGVAIDSGVGSAVVNRSGQEIRRMRAMLLAGTEPERHVLLIQSSRAALGRGQLVLAVVVGFQALEILLETKLRAAYERQGLSEGETTDRLKRFYKTKDRLTVLCREVTGGVSIADDTAFWNLWLTACNRKRNGVVHRNEAVTYSEALRVVELCEQSMNLLSALPFPP
ncbi:MAG: hypothetical protein WAJ87_02135 [Bryobacteraceae bacterium]